MDVLLELAREYPFPAALICAVGVTALAALISFAARVEMNDQSQGHAEAIAYLRENKEPMPGWTIPFTLEELEELLSTGTLKGQAARFTIRDLEMMRDYLRKQSDY